MNHPITEIQSVLEEMRDIAREAVANSHQVENEAAAASLLRNRMELMAITADALIAKVEKASSPAPAERTVESSRQSTEESVRLAFSGVFMH